VGKTINFLPFIVIVVTLPFWRIVAPHDVDQEFFSVAAQVIAVLLLALVIDVRIGERYPSPGSAVPLIAYLTVVELQTLHHVADGKGGPGDFGLALASITGALAGITGTMFMSRNEDRSQGSE
jgi:hypothetical protein